MKTILVTGASSGIGRALAIRAARAGYGVYAVGRNRDALEALRARIENESGFVAVDATDVAVAANARELVARALARFGSIDVLVNNAGFASAGPLSAQSDDALERQFGTHVIGPIALVRESLAALRAAGGHVFMLGSGVARVPIGNLGAYPPAKAAIRSATAILRRELRAQGIAVTYVDPGAVDTPFMARAGLNAAPASILVSPEAVARKILVAVADRPRVLNASAWQSAAVALAELFPRATEALLERAPALVGAEAGSEAGPGAATNASDRLASPDVAALESAPGSHEIESAPANAQLDMLPSGLLTEPDEPESAVAPEPATATEPADAAVLAGDGTQGTSFERALEPHRRRMEKLSLRESFVRDLFVAGAVLDVGEIALRWAGMPNKNERAVTEEVLEALAGAGFLERTTDHAYRVVRVP